MVTFKVSGLENIVKKIEKLTSKNLEIPLKQAGNLLVRFAKNNIKNSRDPDGNPYKPLAKITIVNRRKGSKSQYSDIPLRDTGRLFASIISNAKNNELKVGTNLEYAKIHQYGGNSEIEIEKEVGKSGRTTFVTRTKKIIKIPARPFLGVPPGFEVILPKIFQAYYKKIMKD